MHRRSFMSTSRRAIGTAAILALVVLTARCAEPGTAPTGADAAVTATIGTTERLAESAPALVACPNQAERVVSRVVDASGGSFGIAGTTISIPAGAVARPTTFTLRLP